MCRIFCLAFCAILSALCSIASAQQPKKVPVIGVVLPDTASSYASYLAALLQGLRELSYVEGQNIYIEYRYADGKLDRVPQLATELVALKSDVIVVTGGTLNATKRATNTIPIVVATAGDLVRDGYIASLIRPGGNITGSTNINSELSAKRLELFKESFPKLSRVAVLYWEGNRQDQEKLKETRAAAETLGVRVQSLEMKDPSQIPGAFAAMSEERAQGFIITNNNFMFSNRRQLFELAASKRLPTMCGRDAFAEHGCLLSYAASRVDAFRRAAYFIDKILKGAKPQRSGLGARPRGGDGPGADRATTRNAQRHRTQPDPRGQRSRPSRCPTALGPEHGVATAQA
jgi:putative tryptophan/tyrosine transport system substrate-binding protein